MRHSKKLLFLTGTRADYGKLEPLALIAAANDFFVTFFVTGMHMMEKYGLTKEEIHRRKNFNVVEFVNQRDGDPQDIILAKSIVGFSDFVKEYNPDLVIVHGDRIESMAVTIVCATNYIRCAHVEGGEVSGSVDEIFRHCNTKLSSDHLVSSEVAKKRVMRLGESPDFIHVIGSPELDIHGKASGVTIEQVCQRYCIPQKDFGICIFHPVTSEIKTIEAQAKSLFEILTKTDRFFVVILPNNDPGSDLIVNVIDTLSPNKFRVLPSMRFNYFSELLKQCALVVGNSSVGVREAPFLGIPSIDVGSRQTRRSNADSVFHSLATDQNNMLHLIHENWGKKFSICKEFGCGDSNKKFLEILKGDIFWNIPSQKHFVE